MGIKAVLCNLDLCNGYVAAVVAHTLIVGQQVVSTKPYSMEQLPACRRAMWWALMARTSSLTTASSGSTFAGKMQITLAESISGAVQNILHRILQHLQLVAGILRELDVFGVHLFGRFHQVYGMVADALKIADGVQQGIYALAVGMVQLTAGKLDEIGAESVLVTVYLRLLPGAFCERCRSNLSPGSWPPPPHARQALPFQQLQSVHAPQPRQGCSAGGHPAAQSFPFPANPEW